jgi:hypothetical protein
MDDNKPRVATAVKALITGVLVVVVALAIAVLISIGAWLWAVSQSAN